MSAVRDAIFPHRQNDDGTYDSICTSCFLTVATARSEGELKALEKNHVCHSSLLAERGMYTDKLRNVTDEQRAT